MSRMTEMNGLVFDNYVGVDYSGEKTSETKLPGIRIYAAERGKPPKEQRPSRNRRGNWTRRSAANWLVTKLNEDQRTLVGIDHGFAFPHEYFKRYRLSAEWPKFLDDFQEHWPTDELGITVNYLHKSCTQKRARRCGDKCWFRLTEKLTAAAKSVFHFGVPGQVGTSTHAGLPWLRYIRKQTSRRVHFWPFDDWQISADLSVVAEVNPSLWRRRFPRERRNIHQHDAFSIAAWMQRADMDGSLACYFHPYLTPGERTVAKMEGWILGVL